jgi:hypothetical protein
MGRSSSLLLARAALGLGPLLLLAYLFLAPQAEPEPRLSRPQVAYQPRKPIGTSGYVAVAARLHWRPNASLEGIAAAWHGAAERNVRQLDLELAAPEPGARLFPLLMKAVMLNYSGEPARAGTVLGELRAVLEADDRLAAEWLYTVIFYQGVTGLRLGETENCVRCCGEGACVLPIAPTAVHDAPAGSRLAVRYFTEYLGAFPEDLEVRWLLNLAHMTLGEYPGKVDPRYLIRLDAFESSGAGEVGRFEDVSSRVGLGGRLNWAGGAVMDDFDADGRLDIVVSSSDPEQPMAYYRNKGDGTFEERTAEAGLSGQLGGLYCVQADYDNDGRPDLFVARGGWLTEPMRPSLLRNTGGGTFADVTAGAGLLAPANAGCAAWADYDGDGRLDLFVGCETGPNRLYRNRGDGTFEEAAGAAGAAGPGGVCKGCAWFDYDNDGRPDLFVNYHDREPRLYHNTGGSFADVTSEMGIGGPRHGFSCWAFDYDNDGWEDLFVTSYERTLADVVRGLIGLPHGGESGRLYRNLGGKGFRDVTRDAGLDAVFSPMGSNFGDFDNDGFLDFYLGTGDPNLEMLVPNRMFRNAGGRRFVEVTGPSGTGLLQKGHGVACGDWDRDGAVDVFVESGGTVPGDRFHNALFRNPGPRGHWLSLKLVGTKSNRSAIGARIKVVTGGAEPRAVYRTVTTGSSFGANPLEVHVGLGPADRAAVVEVVWPAGGPTQVFRDIPADRHLEITEGVPEPRVLTIPPVPLPR